MAKVINAETHSITIENVAIPVRYERVPLESLQVDPTNPRIREELKRRTKKGAPSQVELRAIVAGMPGVDDLQRQVRDNGGLHDPVLVLPDGTVVEGNCRIVVLHRLRDAKGQHDRWNTVPILRLPKLSARQIAVIQAQYHVARKNQWRKLDQAGHLYDMHKVLKISEEDIAAIIGLQVKVVRQLLKTYTSVTEKIMTAMKDGDGISKFSHVNELYKRKDLEEFREDPKRVDLALKLIADGKLKKGSDVRDLKRISDDKDAMKVLLKDGHDAAVRVLGQKDPTVDSAVLRKLKSTVESLQGLQKPDLDRITSDPNAAELIRELHRAVRDVAKVAKVRLE